MLYDGACGFCSASVRFVLAHERRQSLRFASLQSTTASALRAQHPELRAVDSIVWVEPSAEGGARVWVRSAAVLRIARYLGGLWRVAAIGYFVPQRLRDRLYDFIARHRHQILPAPDTCWLPPLSTRARFLD